MVTLGLGCIGIGREWGVASTQVPSEDEAIAFLHEAFSLGMRYFNTAPAYGHSEERLGKWYRELAPSQQETVTIATKFGEFWDFKTSSPYRNYSYQKLKESIDRSFELLEKINVLQVHGFTKEVWEQNVDDINRAIDYAKSRGVRKIGASLSNPDATEIVLKHAVFQVVQIPHNIVHPYDREFIKNALSKNKTLVINRPFAMGEVAQINLRQAKVDAYKFILKDVSEGIILTGTKSAEHLKENIEIFNQALDELKS